MLQPLLAYLTYIPLTAIGIWRWSYWLVRMIGAAMYRPEHGEFKKGEKRPTVSVVTPVYNENPELFDEALKSWIANGVDEIVAVIDKSNFHLIASFERNYVRTKHGRTKCRLVVTPRPGKRAVLVEGIGYAKGDIIALVDSDTVWDTHVTEKALPCFKRSRIGAVTVAQRISNLTTTSNVLFDMLLWNRYREEVPFLLGMGQAFNTLSGRTAFYRREALLNDAYDNMHDLRHEFFMGTRSVSGDDKRLTHLILEQGWHVAYAKGATVYTQGLGKMRVFMKQRLRWTRNSWRADLRAVKRGWVFKHPALAYFMIDRFIQPFFMLLGPIAFVIGIINGDWLLVGILLAWWVVSRVIKLFGYFRKHPKRLIYLPAYIIYTYTNALIKIYALGTLIEHSWATRGHKEHKSLLQKLRLVSAGAAVTFLVLYGLTDFITTLQREAATNVYAPAPVVAGSYSMSQQDLAAIANGQKKQVSGVDPTQIKQYITQAGDTLTTISAKTCLSIQELKRINGIKSINHIDVNQTFFYYCPAAPGATQ